MGLLDPDLDILVISDRSPFPEVDEVDEFCLGNVILPEVSDSLVELIGNSTVLHLLFHILLLDHL